MDSRSSAQKAEAARPALVASISHFGQVSGPQRCPWVCGLSGSPVGSFRAVDCQTDDWFEALCRRGLTLSLGHRPLNVGADTGFPGALAWWLGFRSTNVLLSECRRKRHCLLWHCCGPSCWFSRLWAASLPFLSFHRLPVSGGEWPWRSAAPHPVSPQWQPCVGCTRSPGLQGNLNCKEPTPRPFSHQTARPSAPCGTRSVTGTFLSAMKPSVRCHTQCNSTWPLTSVLSVRGI